MCKTGCVGLDEMDRNNWENSKHLEERDVLVLKG